ncbi:hypothetical protein JTE90_028551 [Oedothorax gibbosus]|uniref:Tropomyosin n=1 Tax=Oedothorax gibbosus TaxID=931172 RepID=A0AAV6VUN6_9ARAC|nr:hypothetical protein JTE90_028551 [Oedothorax gibbosus]
MEAIKKKMQAMKLEKENAVDRAEAAEQAARDANIRAEKNQLKSRLPLLGPVAEDRQSDCTVSRPTMQRTPALLLLWDTKEQV